MSSQEPGQPDEQIKKAVQLINSGMFEDAKNILHGLENNDLLKGKAYFLLGRIYKETGSFEQAEDYLKRAANFYPLLKDYALKLLADVYISTKRFENAVEALRQIQSKTLFHETKQAEVSTLLAMDDKKTAADVLSQYIRDYPAEWNSKLLLAGLLKDNDRKAEAVTLLKEIYINASLFAADAFKELKALGADSFTFEEMLKRAENLFKNGSFKSAEAAYKEVLDNTDNSALKDEITFLIGMCQFNSKQYDAAVKTFGLIKSPEAFYWKARALYRIDALEDFEKIINEFQSEYPKNHYLARLFLLLADEKRRTDKPKEAERIYNKVINNFPEEAESAQWGLGWLNYTSGNYKEAERLFSILASSAKNNGQYLYWKARSREMLSEKCALQNASFNTRENACPDIAEAYSSLLNDRGYYGFLVRSRFNKSSVNDRVKNLKNGVPGGEVFERIEALKLFGMNKDAVNEIKMILKSKRNPDEFKYLGQTAIELGEYKSVIYLAENTGTDEFLPFSYPLAFWETVRNASENKGVDPYLVVALMREESRFDSAAVSRAGAIGLMQLMPFTAYRIKKELNIELRNDSELYGVEKNILIGTHYFSKLIKEFKTVPLAIAAYNAGENALKKWLLDSRHKDAEEFIEDIPYQETRYYVKKVLKSYWQYRALYGLPVESN